MDPSSEILQPDFDWPPHVVTWLAYGEDSDPRDQNAPPAAELVRGTTVSICTYKRAASTKRLLDCLPDQADKPTQLIIVDASDDAETEQMVKSRNDHDQLADRVLYVRVGGKLRGLTRQRNFSMKWVQTDLVVFFDDDVVLDNFCLREMARPFRQHDDIVGVGAFTDNHNPRPNLLWRVRAALKIVPDLRPGSYSQSGMSIPWFVEASGDLIEGDWLPGYGMMWRTAHGRDLGFCEAFDSYAQSEDLDFALRMRQRGRVVMAGPARLQHLPDPAGRPNHFRLGYMAIRNRYEIYRRIYRQRSWGDDFRFVYAWTMDSVLLGRHLLIPSRWGMTFGQLAGRISAGWHCLSEQSAQPESTSPSR